MFRRSGLASSSRYVLMGAFVALASPGAQAAPMATVVHVGRLLDRPGQPPRGPSTITIADGRIVAIVDGHQPAPAGARVIDLRDRFVLPGLIDSHVHLESRPGPAKALEAVTLSPVDLALRAAVHGEATLQAGFTTVRNLGGSPAVRALRDATAAGVVAGPTIIDAGNGIGVTGGHSDVHGVSDAVADALRRDDTSTCDGADACRRAARDRVRLGADVIKIAVTGGVTSDVEGGLGKQMTADEVGAVVEAAHSFGRKVAAHAHSDDGIMTALEAGVDSVEHGTFISDRAVRLFKEKGTFLVPTLLAFEHVANATPGTGLSAASLAKAREVAKVATTNISRAIKLGVPIAFGTDSGVMPHGRNAREFELLVAGGLTPAEAIRAATVDAAKLLGRSRAIGTLEVGKDADLIAVEGSPLEDVRRLQHIDFVMRRGVVHRAGGQRQPFPAP